MSRNKDIGKKIHRLYSGLFFTQISFLVIKSIFILCLAKYFTFSILKMSNIFHFSEFFASIISFLILLFSTKIKNKKILAIFIGSLLPLFYFIMHQNFENFQILTVTSSFVFIMAFANTMNYVSRGLMESASIKARHEDSGHYSKIFVSNNVGMFVVYATMLISFPFFFRQSDSLLEITSFCISTSFIALISFFLIPSEDFAPSQPTGERNPFYHTKISVRVLYVLLLLLITAPLVAVIKQGWTLWYYQSFHLIRSVGKYKIFPEQMLGFNVLFVSIFYPSISRFVNKHKIKNTTQLIIGSFCIFFSVLIIFAIQKQLIISNGSIHIVTHLAPRMLIALGELLLASSIISILKELTSLDSDSCALILAFHAIFACLTNVSIINFVQSKIGPWIRMSLMISATCTACVLLLSLLIAYSKKLSLKDEWEEDY